MLAFSLNKDSYEIGETAMAIIPAAANGRALVSIENGSTVLKQEWIEVSSKGDTKYTFKITEEMAPNVYLHISLLQPHAQTVNDLPIDVYKRQLHHNRELFRERTSLHRSEIQYKKFGRSLK